MKKIAVVIVLLMSHYSQAQYNAILPFENQNFYFNTFYNGAFRQLEYQKVQSYKYGDNIIGYVDNKGDLKVFTGKVLKSIAPLQNEYAVSDNYLVMRVGNVLSVWSEKYGGSTLTNFGGEYMVTDSLVVFEDTQQNALKAFYQGEIITLSGVIGDISLPKNVGDNIILFNAMGMYYVFYHGQRFDLDSWQEDVKYDCGRDIAAFNDPVSYTFAIFENGQFLDLDSFHAKEFKCGNGCVTYVDNNGNLQYYSHGDKHTLSSYGADYWEAKDSMVVWGENSYFYVWDGKNKINAATYKPESWLIKNNIVAFKNQMGGVSCVKDGKVTSIYNGMVNDFYIMGNSVILYLPNYSYLVYSNGKKYNN